ncbi:hypothetical protein [Kitasatospora sp. NPDC058046]|uniref:hypothetical protein n=1 Tax=Kitasatospora sp. NPDC058046 TaxID=3346312 RepID=UPI0036DF89E1
MPDQTLLPDPLITITWVVQAAADGRWRTVSVPTDDRSAAREDFNWRRQFAPDSITYRLVRTTTTVTTEIEQN